MNDLWQDRYYELAQEAFEDERRAPPPVAVVQVPYPITTEEAS